MLLVNDEALQNAESEKFFWVKIYGIFPKRTKAVVEYFDYSQK